MKTNESREKSVFGNSIYYKLSIDCLWSSWSTIIYYDVSNTPAV